MSRMNSLITSSLVASALLGGSCATVQNGERRLIYVTHPEAIPGSNYCPGLKAILDSEFDYVSCTTVKGDPVIRGEERVGNSYVTVWGLNLNDVCQVSTTGRPVLEYIMGNDVIADTNRGTVVSRHLSHEKAEMVAESLHLRALGNETNCKDWTIMIQNTYGPFGPVDAKYK